MDEVGQFLRGPQYPIWFHCSSHNPLNNTTYYVGMVPSAPTTTASLFRIPIPQSGRIRRVGLLTLVGGTLGTAEQGTAYVRVNNLTDYLISDALLWNNLIQSVGISFDDLDIELAQSDYVEIKIVTPTFVLPPTLAIYNGAIWVDNQ